MITRFTDKQVRIDKIIREEFLMKTEMEKDVGEFSLDIWVIPLQLDLEIQGPHHYKKETQRREDKLRSYGIKHFLYVPSSITNKQFRIVFMEYIRSVTEGRYE